MDKEISESQERPGYRFEGWFVDEERTKRLNPGADLPGNITIYDKWVPVDYPVTYRLPFGINNRRNPKTVCITDGIRKLFPPLQNEKFFLGWYWKGERVDYLPEGLHEPIELEARFDTHPTVSFETGLGARVASVQVDDRGYLQPFMNPRRPGYTFGGWFLDPDLRQGFSFGRPVLEDTVLYAAWDPVEYTIEYQLNGGRFLEEPITSFTYDTETFLLPSPVKKGCCFLGWQDGRGNPVVSIPRKTMSSRIVKACWKENTPEVFSMRKKNH